MAGLQGGIGAIDAVTPHSSLSFTGDEQVDEFTADDFEITALTHPDTGMQQSYATADGDTCWWVWGRVYAADFPEGTEAVTAEDSTHVCANLIEQDGVAGAKRLNGTFLAVGYDTAENHVVIVTDRMGSRPLYYARTADGIVFSTNIQSFATHPDVDTSVDAELFAEYGALGRVTGLETPLDGVKAFPPASVITVDADSLTVETERYWSPHYEQADVSFEAVTDRFVGLLEQILEERLVPGRTYGFLLSGGSDSRLLLDIATDILPNSDIVAYHLSDWMNDEARAAERAALTAGVEFRWLRRRPNSQERKLSLASGMMNFYGRTEQAHTAEFTDRLRDEVDCLVSGLYADTFFRAHALPHHTFDFGPLGTFHSPTIVPTNSVEDYLDRYPETAPAYVNVDRSLREILRSHLTVDDDGTVTDHGVVYPSLRDLSMYVDLYPLWNDPDMFYWGLEQTMPHWTPFLDNRLVSLATSVPLRYQARRNLSNAGIKSRESPLAEFPLARSHVSPQRSFPVHFLGACLTSLARNFTDTGEPPQPQFTHHPWTDIEAVLNTHSFVGEVLRQRQSDIRQAPYLDWEGTLDAFRSHLDGAGNSAQLYALLGFLETPAFEELLYGEATADTAAEPTVRILGPDELTTSVREVR